MKLFMASAGAAALLVTAWTLGGDMALQPSPAAAETVGKMQFMLHLAGVERSCLIDKGVELVDGISQLSVGEDCPRLVPELSDARRWRENADGTVTIVDDDGGALIEFALADGLAYESFRAGAPLVSLVAR